MSSLRQRRRKAAAETPKSASGSAPTAATAADDANGKDAADPPSLLPLLWRALALLAFIATTQIAGLTLFTHGFLRTRTKLPGIARCTRQSANSVADIDTALSALVAQGQATPANWSSVLATHGECTLPARFDRSLLFIADAPRYTFVSSPESASGNASDAELDAVLSQLANGVPTIQALLTAQPRNSFLARIATDPPATTLQRIEALATGIPPTFIDASTNFGAAEIGEDNLLDQFRVRHQANGAGATGMALMGDDTWLSLFPDTFDQAWTWPEDSFHIDNLDKADQGVQSHLRAFLDPKADRTTEAGNWSLLVAHQLGLSRADNRDGPGRADVGRKLTELDSQVRFITDRLPDDALLVFMGDQGIGGKGDQGGTGAVETAATFFAYAKRSLTSPVLDQESLHYTALPKGDTQFSFGTSKGGHHFGSGQFVATETNLTAVGEDYLAFLACSEGYTCKIKVTETGASFAGRAEDSYVFSTTPRDDLAWDDLFVPSEAKPGASDEHGAFRHFGPGTAHRSIQQVDLVPTFALLHGLPIPFNSLGTVVPELFGEDLLRALRINALQVNTYLNRYMGQSGEINGFVRELQGAWARAARADWARAALPASSPLQVPLARTAEQAYFAYTRLALARAKQAWAHFDLEAMAAGLALLVLGTLSAVRLRSAIGAQARPVAGLRAATNILGYAAGMGFVISGPALALVLGLLGLWNEVSVLELVPAVRARSVLGFIFCVQLGFANVILLGKPGKTIRALIPSRGTLIPAGIVLVHALSLASNSFIAWEGHVTVTLLQVLILLSLAAGARIRFASLFSGTAGEKAAAQRDFLRTGALAVLGIVLSRFLLTIRACREEQAPYCTTTFDAHLVSSPTGDSARAMSPAAVAAAAVGNSANSLWASALALATAYWLVPSMVRLVAGLTESDTRLVQLYVKWLLRSILVAGAIYWVLDTLSAGATGLRPPRWALWSDYWKRPLAWLEIVVVLLSIFVVWPASPLPLELRMERVPSQPGVQRPVLTGLRNLLGMHYLLLLLFLASFVFLLAQPMGQVALGLIIAVVLCLAEVSAGGLQSLREWGKLETVSPLVLATLHLLSHVAFFSTGHQAAVSSIQWRAAFVGFRQLTYPFALVFVAVNTLGPSILIVLAVPLLVLWRHAPRPRGVAKGTEGLADEPMATLPYLARAALGYAATTSIATIAAAVWASVMRRHLMLSKVWAPRYILAALSLASTHIFLLLGVAAAGLVCIFVSKVLGTPFEARQYAEFETEED